MVSEVLSKALAVLRDVEWGDHETYNWGNSERQRCPSCYTVKGQPHEYCDLTDAIKMLEAEIDARP